VHLECRRDCERNFNWEFVVSFQSTELTPLRELFELLQIKSELFEPNQPQTSSNSDFERVSTPQPSEGQESSSYESQYDGRFVKYNFTINDFCPEPIFKILKSSFLEQRSVYVETFLSKGQFSGYVQGIFWKLFIQAVE